MSSNNKNQSLTSEITIDIVEAIPFPLCLLALNGDLLHANEFGKALYKKLPNSFFSSDFKKVKNNNKSLFGHSIVVDDRKYLLTALPTYKNRQLCGILTLFEDFTIHKSFFKHDLEMYQATIEDLQTIFDNSYDVLYVSDGNGKTLRASSACEELWGKKPEELIGKSVFDLEREGIYSPSATRIALEQGKKIQTIQKTKTGRRLMVVSTPIHDINGKITRIVNASRDITEIHELEEEIKQMKTMIEGYRKQLSKPNMATAQNKLIYRSKPMKELVSMLTKVALVDSTVLITGESGVGKEVIANYIHMHSYKETNPFVKINCAAIPETLLESELFGYEPGAFTGAIKGGKAGLFELADEGTLFLDEIGDMSLKLQAKLLRVLQDGEIRRVGSQMSKKINVRIVAATNQDLQTKIKEDLFRKDLYYRLNVIPIKIPPLRERREDIVPLIQHFLAVNSNIFHQTKSISHDVLNHLEQYDWPGNIRELQNIVERLVVTSDSVEIGLSSIPGYIIDIFEPTKGQNTRSPNNTSIEVHHVIPLNEAVALVEKQILQQVGQDHSTLNEMAQILGVNQSTISRKMQRYGLSK